MKAIGALPTEERIQRMNDPQWLWCYLNIVEDEKEEEEKWKTRLDYLGWYVDAEKFKSVADIKRKSKTTNNEYNEDGEIFDEKPVINNDSFEEEMRRALSEMGEDPGQFTELPDSNEVGDPSESKNDFLNRVLNNQHLAFQGELPIGIESHEELEEINNPTQSLPSTDDLKEIGIDPDDIDYFEFPE